MVTCSFSQLEEMSEEEKHNIIARFIPCDSCSCNGFHPYNDKDGCYCGHEAFHHIDKGQDLDRRLKVALRLNELLEVSRERVITYLSHIIYKGKRQIRRLFF